MESDKPAEPEVGAPIAKDAVDPELVRLSRPRPRFGVITSAGVVLLAALFTWRLAPDRRFGAAGSAPDKVTAADVLAGKIGADRYVEIDAQPVVADTIRSTTAKGDPGWRIVPARSTGERLWLAVPGDEGEPPALGTYRGRLRALADLPLAASVRDYAATTSRPVFGIADAVRAALAGGALATTSGDRVTVHDGDRVAFDIDDVGRARVVCTLTAKLADAAAWQRALADADIAPTGQPSSNANGTLAFDVAAADAVATVSQKLAAAQLWAARVEAVRHHTETTWGALRTLPLPAGLDIAAVFVVRPIANDAYALVVGATPDDFWYASWVMITVGVIGLLFVWELVRAVRRDLLPAR